jgi:transposase
MRYSLGFKEALVKKVLSPSSRSVFSVAKEAGVSYPSLRKWLKQAKDGTLEKQDAVGPAHRSSREKLSLLLEAKSLLPDDQGKWLRAQGLHSEHITLYEQELRDLMDNKDNKAKEENKQLKQENKRLKRELEKKEKALAEMAALYTLKKKAEKLWEENEDG